MCIICHQGLKDSNIEEQLLNILNTPKFENINDTSVSHFSLVALGINGSLAKERALTIIEAYIGWKKNNILENDDNFLGQPSANTVQKQLNKIRKFNEISQAHNLTQEDIKNMIYNNNQNGKNYYTEIFGKEDKLNIFMVLKRCAQYGINELSVFMGLILTKIKYLFNQITNFTSKQDTEEEEVYKNRID